MDRFAQLPQVTLAAVEGYALGGGCMLPSPRISASPPTARASACPR